MIRRTCTTLVKRHQYVGGGYKNHDSEGTRKRIGLWALQGGARGSVQKMPEANKMPHDYTDITNRREGREWREKWVGENAFSQWPWVTWQNDPIRGHKSNPYGPSRTISALAEDPTAGMPLWDHYGEASLDYGLTNDAPASVLAPYINTFAGRVWTQAQMKSYLELMVAEGWESVEDLHVSIDYIREWNGITAKVPAGFIEHVAFLAADVVNQNAKKAFRAQRQKEGDLRTEDMTKYYAMPYYTGPAMPTTLEQPSGREPTESPYMLLHRVKGKIHPIYRFNGTKKGHMPA